MPVACLCLDRALQASAQGTEAAHVRMQATCCCCADSLCWSIEQPGSSSGYHSHSNGPSAAKRFKRWSGTPALLVVVTFCMQLLLCQPERTLCSSDGLTCTSFLPCLLCSAVLAEGAAPQKLAAPLVVQD